MESNEISNIQIGDIVLRKSSGLLSWMIGESFHTKSPLIWLSIDPFRPSSHNGIISQDSTGNLCVTQALTSGVKRILLSDELKAVNKKKAEIKIVRSRELSHEEKRCLNLWLQNQEGKKYDFLSFISHIWRVFLRLTPITPIQDDDNYWCTELCDAALRLNNITILGEEFPNPLTVEKRVAEGKLQIVAEYW